MLMIQGRHPKKAAKTQYEFTRRTQACLIGCRSLLLCMTNLMYYLDCTWEILSAQLIIFSHTVLECPMLHNPDNGQITYTKVGSVATYACLEGYTISGSETQTCQADGTWTGSQPTCVCKFMAMI